MNRSRRQFLHLAGGAGTLSIMPGIANAQAYPARAVRVIVPFAAGGPTDAFARPVAQKLSEHLGKQFYVENLPGAGGNIGTGQAARSAHDGHTVLMTVNSYVINPSFYKKVPYDPYRDFEPVTLAADITLGLWVHSSVPATSVRELVELIKANPGRYNYASAGVGTSVHLIGEEFRLALGLDLVHVPFNGGGPAITSTMAGHTPIAFTALAPAMPHITKGTLRALAVMSHSESLPDVPTIAEAGYPQIRGDEWIGVFVPAGTPRPVIDVLNREIAAVMALPATKEQLAMLGLTPIASTPEAFRDHIKADLERWAKVMRDANIKAE
jgi:tripartite-type tricarboxylate transporter receptor subunit TctC